MKREDVIDFLSYAIDNKIGFEHISQTIILYDNSGFMAKKITAFCESKKVRFDKSLTSDDRIKFTIWW